MAVDDVLRSLKSDPELGENFVEWREIPPSAAQFVPYPSGTDPRLAAALAKRGITGLYSHQGEAAAHVSEGRNVVVVTPTASGKTLCYNLPVVGRILENPRARALYLFPTKALAQDQMHELHTLVEDLDIDLKTYTYDGDTPGTARRKVREAGHVVVTNPDMLHTGILPHHTKWVKLFENLEFVVIDELHQYRGVFGSHLANVLRRLRRICRFYGSRPLFVCCSATIANPQELAARLVGEPVELVDKNGAPSGRKIIGIYNPPVVHSQLNLRQSAVRSAEKIATRLIQGGVQTIVFAPSRMRVEILLQRIRSHFSEKPGVPSRIAGYRAGYLPNERRAIERSLRDGTLRGVVSTNALELGIDIGGLEASVLTGFPGTLASAWQQMGRAGRQHESALAILVTSSSPLNQYVAAHSDYLFETSPEAGLIDPDNLLVLISHLKCAAFELPVKEDEEFGANTKDLLRLLADEEVLIRSGEEYHWMAEAFPAEGVSLRSASIDNFVIIESGPQPRVIGEIDRPSAPLLVHDEAIYIHGGVQYHVDRLDWDEKKAYVHRVDVEYYTDANLAVNLEVLESFAEREEAGGAVRVEHGEVAVRDVATIFKKIKLSTNENVGWGKIQLPEENRHTTAYWFSVDPPRARPFAENGLTGLGHLLRHLAPVFLLCDPRDLQWKVDMRSPFTTRSTLFLYENQPGGVGLAKHLYEIHDRLVRAASEILGYCPCEDGCPGCIGPASGALAEREVPRKEAARKILEILQGEAVAPDATRPETRL